MTRYFFDSRDGDALIPDEVGLEFATIDEARDEAAVCLAEMATFTLPGSTRRELAIEVRDEVLVLRTSLVLRRCGCAERPADVSPAIRPPKDTL